MPIRALAAASVAAVLALPAAAHAAAPLTVAGLTADRQSSPLGLGDARPDLGWTLAGDGRGREQSAYEVVVSSGGADVWDSGEIHSSASANVPYGGPALASGTQYTWKVRAWDESGQVERLERARHARDRAARAGRLEGEVDRRADVERLELQRRQVDLGDQRRRRQQPARDDALPARHRRAAAAPASGRLLFTVDDEAAVYVNGTQVIDTKTQRDADENAWQKAQSVDVAAILHAGVNTIAVQVKNRLNGSGGQTPAGFIGRLRATFATGSPVTLDTGSAWKSADRRSAGWEQPGFDDSAWTPARELATYGIRPVGLERLAARRRPTRTCARTSRRPAAVASARLYVSALGMYEVHLNGQKVGDQVLAPGWTEYSKRVPSQTYDVTSLVKPGRQRDRRDPRRGLVRHAPAGRRRPGATRRRLLAQLEITYADGTHAAGSSPTRAGRPAPAALRSSSIYDGESYDAPARPARLGPARLQRAAGPPPASAPTRPRSSPRRRRRSGHPDAQAGQAHPAGAGHVHLRPRPELRRLGAAARSAARRARASGCASASC